MKIIVGHGRGLKPTKACKLGYVREVLTESVRRVSHKAGAWLKAHPRAIEIAYYADLFQHLADEPTESCDSFREPIDRLYRESRLCPTWPKFRGLMKDLAMDAAVLLTRFLDPGVRQQIMSQQFLDILPYFQRPRFAAQVRERLLRVLVPALKHGEPTVLIGHSLGSVVAYDTLWLLSHTPRYARLQDRRIAQFITMGSPLGDQLVKGLLMGWRHPLPQRYPTNILAWDNLSARGDLVCHDAHIGDDFQQMRRLQLITRLTDHENLCAVYRGRQEQWNPHKLYGYLILPQLGRLVAEHIRAHTRTRR